LSKYAQSKSTHWVRPEVKKLSAGSAEAAASGIDDGGPVGSARS
jgi:hypothetical protein